MTELQDRERAQKQLRRRKEAGDSEHPPSKLIVDSLEGRSGRSRQD
jgi:hypothetical protein